MFSYMSTCQLVRFQR